MLKKYFKKLFDLLERPLPYFFTFHLRPKKADKIGIVADKLLKYPRVAIVMQGPIVYDENFTLETIKLYKKIFPEAIVILSTWDYEKAEYLEKIKSEKIELILSKPPVVKGAQNINFQLVSSLAGIEKAKSLGAAYALKTRTDQRIYNPNALEFLFNIITRFLPANGRAQKKRIVGVSLNTFKYRSYGLSDMNLFGDIDDLAIYFSATQDKDGENFRKVNAHYPEVYLSVSYLIRIGRQISWQLSDSWRAFADNFCIVDASSLDLYWNKYSRMKEYKYLKYDEMKNDQEMSFLEWFNIYCNLQNKETIDLDKIKKVIP